MLVLKAELTRALEVENAPALESAPEDAEGLVRKVALLEGELVEAHRAREVVEEKFHSLFDAAPKGAQRLVVSKRERR
jgi:hypothetical protein